MSGGMDEDFGIWTWEMYGLTMCGLGLSVYGFGYWVLGLGFRGLGLGISHHHPYGA